MAVTFLTNEDEARILAQADADKLLLTQQELTDAQKLQARTNIGAAPAGYGWGETLAARVPDGDANNALATGLYRAMTTTANVPARCNLIFVQAASGGIIYQTAYCDDGTLMRVCDHDFWSEWKPIGGSEKVYEHIATITVAPDADGSLPQHVIFTADSEGNPFELTDFMVKAYAGFVDGSASTLNVAVNGKSVISGSVIPSISATLRGFNIFFRQENDHFVRAEHTTSVGNANMYNPAGKIATSFLVPTMSVSEYGYMPVSKVDMFTQAGTTKAWVEGSTFELWGIRA